MCPHGFAVVDTPQRTDASQQDLFVVICAQIVGCDRGFCGDICIRNLHAAATGRVHGIGNRGDAGHRIHHRLAGDLIVNPGSRGEMHLNIGSPGLANTRLMKHEHVGGGHGQQALSTAQVAPQLGGQSRWLCVCPDRPRCLSFSGDQGAKMIL